MRLPFSRSCRSMFPRQYSVLTPDSILNHRNPVGGWTNQPGNTNQIWDFEQYSFTPDELDGHIKSMPLKPGANIVSYTSFEKKYLILPTELYEKIRCTANIAGCRPGVFDCELGSCAFSSLRWKPR